MMDGSQMGDNSTDVIEYDELQEILDELADKQRSVSESTGTLRSRIKGIIDEKGWSKAALAAIRAIENKSETARSDFLRTFEPMFDEMMQHKWRDEMQDMLDPIEGDEV